VDVANDLDIARSTVVRAVGRFERLGVEGLFDQRRGNGGTKVDDAFRRRLVQLLKRTPEHFGWKRPTWTRELLCRQMAREGRATVSVATMGRALAQVGARLGSPKPIVLCPWPRDARERRIAEIRALESRASAAEPVLYEDEVDIHLNPKSDVQTGQLHTTGAARKNAVLFCELLRLLAERYPSARRIHLIVDNYGIHSARATEAQLKELGGRIVLHFLPPYCPDSTRIERVWQDMHANVTRNHRCRNMKDLLANCREYVEAYRWRRVTGIAPILGAA
jgi:transposase